MTKPRIAIIGAGLSGITIGQDLQDFCDVKIFEKSRGCGGRMSTRYAENFAFDHGAQFFTAENKNFQKFLIPFIEKGVISDWKGEIISFKSNKIISARRNAEGYLTACPNMNSLCKKIAENLDISFGCEVAPLCFQDQNGWHLQDKNGKDLGAYDFVISSAPLPQTNNLFAGPIGAELKAGDAIILPSLATMIGFNQNLNLNWILAEAENSKVKSISFNSSKPGRDKNFSCFVINSTEDWAAKYLEDEIANIQKILVKEFENLTGISCEKADYLSTHRWRYALADNIKKCEPFFDQSLRLAATGDWVSGSKIEDVWLSAKKLSKLIKSKI